MISRCQNDSDVVCAPIEEIDSFIGQLTISMNYVSNKISPSSWNLNRNNINPFIASLNNVYSAKLEPEKLRQITNYVRKISVSADDAYFSI